MKRQLLVVVGSCVALATTGLAVSCGDTTTNNVTVIAIPEAGGDATLQPGDGGGSDAGDASISDASADVETAADADDGSICNAAPAGSISTDCNVVALCPGTLQCSAGPSATFYKCANDGRPDLPNCYHVVAPGPGAGQCCPAACVRSSSADSKCGAGTPHAYSCLTNGSNGTLAAPSPSPSCVNQMPTADPTTPTSAARERLGPVSNLTHVDRG